YEGAPTQRHLNFVLVGCPAGPAEVLLDSQPIGYDWNEEEKKVEFGIDFSQRSNLVISFGE
ncbi:MAG: hypothetical protein KDC32_28515, partial [Saprospiraceae bacterium]|nr:hypothetical protein [Saprospiraceae bacterium]